jgi:hypothetical protein
MKPAQDYKNISHIYCQNRSSNSNSTSLDAYLKLFSEKNPVLTMKRMYENHYLYEWKSPMLFFNGFSPCLILEVRTKTNVGKTINLQNKNILEKIAYSNFVLTEENILNKKSEVMLLGYF